jgi:hypothetical protein
VRLIPLAVILALAAGPAFADATRDALTEMAKCADITDDMLRLKCFDEAMPRAKSALATPVPAVETKKSLLDWFGFARPSKPVTKTEDFGKPSQPIEVPGESKEITEITANVVEFAKTGRGKAIFVLDNGQVWRQSDSDGTEIPYAVPGTPMKVTIEIGVFGSYNLIIEGRNGLIKATRVK